MSDAVTPTSGLTIRQAQDRVDDWIKTVGVRYFDEIGSAHV